uniref:MATH domain-containing protein n=1 Tax=Caenorhabditis tropicalis TaxID=1561998 RepID=A0A1I7UKT1_9PELO
MTNKYPINGVCFFENAREHMEANDFPRIPIGTIGGIYGWYLTMRQEIVDGVTYYLPFIFIDPIKPKVKCRWYLRNLKNDGSWGRAVEGRRYLRPHRGCLGRGKRLDGYLRNGGITVEYGFEIEAILFRE